MRAHADDLRAEVADFGIADDGDGGEADRFAHAIAADWRSAPLTPADAALCAYAEKLTLRPAEMTADDLDALREHGFDERAIHDAAQVVSAFNYFNRVADGLGLEPEGFMRAWEERGDPRSDRQRS